MGQKVLLKISWKNIKVKKTKVKRGSFWFVLSNSIAPTGMAESHFIIRLLLFIQV